MKGKSSTIAIVLLLLVGFPLASYLYLRQGMNFRLGAIEALHVKSNLPMQLHDTAMHTVELIFNNNTNNQMRVDSIRNHFSDRADIMFRDFDFYPEVLVDSLSVAMESTGLQQELTEVIFLVNKHNQIVNCYSSSDEISISNLIEHIAFLIPPDPEKDFDFIRAREK